ncbi:MAG: hypothetical protein U0Q22_18135 [Acidimicrobiales bacterium]
MSDDTPASPSRAIWQLLEPLHAVTYFATPCRDALAETGLKGFWMGYFAGRSAPMGPATAAAVEATFYNFAPGMVRRAIPDAWSRATPSAVLDARALGAAVALRQAAPDAEELTRRALPLLESAAAAARCEGRTLAATNQALELRADPVERLWQAATTLREHRGDGHVAALVASDIGGLEAHVLSTLTSRAAASPERLQQARGWSADDWEGATDRLRARGLVDGDGAATDTAHVLSARVEQITDELAAQPYRDGLTETGLDLLRTVLRPFTAAVLRSGLLPFPNPIGLPAPTP